MKNVVFDGVNPYYGFAVTVTENLRYVGEFSHKKLIYSIYIDDKLIASFEEKGEAFVTYMNLLKVGGDKNGTCSLTRSSENEES